MFSSIILLEGNQIWSLIHGWVCCKTFFSRRLPNDFFMLRFSALTLSVRGSEVLLISHFAFTSSAHLVSIILIINVIEKCRWERKVRNERYLNYITSVQMKISWLQIVRVAVCERSRRYINQFADSQTQSNCQDVLLCGRGDVLRSGTLTLRELHNFPSPCLW